MIYTILMCEKLENVKGFPFFGATRLVGYYTSEDDAVMAVLGNVCDIQEMCYHYAIIERVKEGVYGCDPEYTPRVFKYMPREKHPDFIEIAQPNILNGYGGFSMG